MAKIRYSVDGRGVLKATADIQVSGTTMKIGVTGAALQGQEGGEPDAWGQLTLDLFNLKKWLQDEANKPEGGK